jgi:uncharacterized membrane protein HdeD (DUF308 family)
VADSANSPETGLSASIVYVYPWWLVLLWGLLSLIIGVMFLGTPAATTVFLITLIGVFWLVGGFFTLGSLAVEKTHVGIKIFISVIDIVAGLLILAYPLFSTIFALALFVIFAGGWGCFIGISHLYHAFRKKDPGSGVLGVISLIFGILLLAFPLVAAALIPFIIGIFALAGGVAAVVASLSIKKVMCGPEG